MFGGQTFMFEPTLYLFSRYVSTVGSKRRYYSSRVCVDVAGRDGCRFCIACIAGVFFGRAICSRNRHVETSRREGEMGRVKGYYFYSPQTSTVIKSKMAATTILIRTRTRFRRSKIRMHCRLFLYNVFIPDVAKS